MKNQWWLEQAKEIEDLAERRNSKGFFKAIKLVAQRKNSGLKPINSSTGSRITEKQGILDRWKEHFSSLLNNPSTADISVLDNIPQETVI